MDKLILGLLILKNSTLYELHGIIHNNLQAMCSDSIGAIQAAVKKLRLQEMINFISFIENGKHKKEYYVTPKGMDYFKQWVNEPMEFGKSRNPEVGKLYFMGLTQKENRIELINHYIEELKTALEYMLAIRRRSQTIEAAKGVRERYLEGIGRLADMGQLRSIENLSEAIEEIRFFSLLSLDYGIYNLENEIKWYEQLKEKI